MAKDFDPGFYLDQWNDQVIKWTAEMQEVARRFPPTALYTIKKTPGLFKLKSVGEGTKSGTLSMALVGGPTVAPDGKNTEIIDLELTQVEKADYRTVCLYVSMGIVRGRSKS